MQYYYDSSMAKITRLFIVVVGVGVVVVFAMLQFMKTPPFTAANTGKLCKIL